MSAIVGTRSKWTAWSSRIMALVSCGFVLRR
jgi:hypothetical protein